ncbi:TonB-dependent siderophore receptor [Rhizobium straminoryzae]|uniref:TonB-dependent siderophore receptor n=1 Tax=Rhizobium straminoryzae TaxID=1387186 RepID=A0A549T7H1_9HYPH|nr:TonB-dependent siderophore receptor [Rhizobium straminoryzae]TRL37800.1 TonB-dependent siderophore receptor [Rhizobium straminoryzae]
MQHVSTPAGRARTGTRHRLLSASVAAVALLGTAPLPGAGNIAHAQETVLDPVLVQGSGSVEGNGSVVAKQARTATKTDTPILDVPASVSVVTQKEIEERGTTNTQEVLAYTAGVFVDEFGSDDRYDYFRIRGFDQTTLGTYRDGLAARIPAWFTAQRLEPYGLERVEVLKGSTSTLFGLNAPGGLINAITKRPQDAPHAEVYTTLGDGHVETGTDFGGPLDAEGVYSYRLTAKWQNADMGTAYSNDDRLYIAPALTISPDAGTSLTLLADYSKRESSVSRGFPMGVAIDTKSFLGEPELNRFNTIQKDIGYQFSHDFDNGLTFRQSARYTHISLNYGDVYGASTDPTADRTAFTVDGVADRFVIDNQLQYDASLDRVDSKTLVGLDYAYDKTHENILMGTAGGIDIFNPVYCGLSCITLGPYVDWKVKQKALGLYAQEELTLDDRWILTLGGRYDHVNTRADYLLTGTADDTTENAFTKRIGLTYKATPALSAYANYSTSFQPLVAPTVNYGTSASLKPQEGEQVEFGVKYQPEGFNGLFSLAVFDLSQTNVPTTISPTETRQTGEVTVRGIELEGKFELSERWNMTLAYSYWDAEITGDDNAALIGNRPERVPRHIASAWASYTLPGNGVRGDITLGGGVRYVGASYGDRENTVKVADYALFDLSALYKVTDNLNLQVTAKNLFDKEYVTTCYYGSCYFGDRRSVLASVKYTW